MSAADPTEALFDARVVAFMGKGGVGKTTSAAAYALEQSREERVLLLSTDPAHSLGDLFPTLPTGAGGPHEVDGGEPQEKGKLAVETLDAKQKTDAFRSRYADTIREIVRRGTFFGDEDIARVLQISLPGMDEVMAFLRLAELLEVHEDGGSGNAANTDESGFPDRASDIDRVVVDTAPTGHTLRLLDMPDRFRSWLDVLDGMLDKHRTLRAVFGNGAPDPLDAFLDEMYARVDRVAEGLQDSSMIQAAVITREDPLVKAETERLLAALSERGISVGAVILNGYSGPAPEANPSTVDEFGTGSLDPSPEISQRDAAIPAPVRRGEVPVTVLPHDSSLTSEDARVRRSSLEEVWTRRRKIPDRGWRRADRENERSGGEALPPWNVENPAPRPEARVVMVAGKGGVGKTTIACATALRLAVSVRRTSQDPDARRRPPPHPTRDVDPPAQPRILLASTDPAHSVADVFCIENTERAPSTPVPVAPGLDVLEIDAASRFSALRERYRDEVRAAFDDVGGRNVDLPFDRAVTESMLDLTPPGIDEVMGWVAVMEFVRRDEYHACVIDTAPTGHFQQLVNMPERVAEWTRAMFRILRAHRDVLRMPAITDRLVRLSKQTKRWREMQATGQIQVVAVTRPEPVVQSETLRLAQYLQRQSLPVHSAVMNAVTPPEDRTSAEQNLIETFHSTLHASAPGSPASTATPNHATPNHATPNHSTPNDAPPGGERIGNPVGVEARPSDRPLPVPLVHRHPGPRPADSLAQLGRALYT